MTDTAWHDGFDREGEELGVDVPSATEASENACTETEEPLSFTGTELLADVESVRVAVVEPVTAPATEPPVVVNEEPAQPPEAIKTATFAELRAEYMSRLQESWRGISDLFTGAGGMKIMEKTVDEWKDYFHVKIPPSPSMAQLHDCLSRTNSLIVTANHRMSIAQLTRDAVQREVKSLRAQKFVAIKRGANGKKPPSNDMASMQVDKEMAEHLDQLMIAEYAVVFWDNKRQSLVSTRKTLEAMTFGLSSEMKMKTGLPNMEDAIQQKAQTNSWLG